MFFEVRVYKADGTMKQKLSSAELNDIHWKTFEQVEGEIGLNTSGKKPVPAWVKAKLDLEFPTNFELGQQNFQC